MTIMEIDRVGWLKARLPAFPGEFSDFKGLVLDLKSSGHWQLGRRGCRG